MRVNNSIPAGESYAIKNIHVIKVSSNPPEMRTFLLSSVFIIAGSTLRTRVNDQDYFHWVELAKKYFKAKKYKLANEKYKFDYLKLDFLLRYDLDTHC